MRHVNIAGSVNGSTPCQFGKIIVFFICKIHRETLSPHKEGTGIWLLVVLQE
jgi:hypothetical protein